jgi:hypothetical protein
VSSCCWRSKRNAKKGSLISAFNDRNFYNGAVPTEKYIQNMLIHFSLLIQTFLEAEMKKWPVDGLSMIDTSKTNVKSFI